jgi:hypothetical protein
MRLFKIFTGGGLSLALFLLSSPCPAQRTLLIDRNDSLWNIAARQDVYGNALEWPLLLDANQDLIESPEMVQGGTTLSIPDSPSPADVQMAVAYALDYNQQDAPHLMALLSSAQARLAAQKTRVTAILSAGVLAFMTLLGLATLSRRLWMLQRRRREQARAGTLRAMLSLGSATGSPQGGPQPTESEAILRAEMDAQAAEDQHREAA